jgi:hypothetical protein
MSGDVRLNCDLEVTLKSDVEWSDTNWTTTAPKYLAIFEPSASTTAALTNEKSTFAIVLQGTFLMILNFQLHS